MASGPTKQKVLNNISICLEIASPSKANVKGSCEIPSSRKKRKIHRTRVQLNGNECHAPHCPINKARAEEKPKMNTNNWTRFADHAKHIKIQMLLIYQLILKLSAANLAIVIGIVGGAGGKGQRERPLSQLQLNATECDNKIIRHRHLETISISHKKSRRRQRRRRREKIPVIFGLFCRTSAAKLAFWQWNANVAG